MTPHPPKARPCKCCKALFTPQRPLARVCSPICAATVVRLANERKAAKAALEDRRETKAKLEAIKKIPKLIKEAQFAFNRFIRARDADQGCISCGAPPPDLSALHAGRDAGHYRSTGSASHLRFHEDNCHAQCVHCNQFGAGKAVDYRIRLIPRIGLARVEALENDCKVHKWTREELRAIKTTYTARARALLKERE